MELFFFCAVENVRLVCGLCTRLPVNGNTGVNKHYLPLYADYMFRFCTLVLLQGAFLYNVALLCPTLLLEEFLIARCPSMQL
jgi:hypothetical protein